MSLLTSEDKALLKGHRIVNFSPVHISTAYGKVW